MSRLTLQITDLGSGIMVQGNDNHFFPDNATLTFPYNSIIVVTDESNMATFRSASNNDVLFSGLISSIEIDGESVTKENINIKFDAIANQSSGGGGDVSGLFASVSYDSDTKHINFYDTDRTLVDYVDATNFIKDGMVSNVEISNGNLVITFNTDAGKEPITIPLTDIFNPSNYYNKTESDARFASQTVVNQEIAARIQGDADINTALGTKADKSDTYTKSQIDALIPDTSDFVNKSEYNPKEKAIAEALTDLNENKADKTELPDVSTLATKTELNAKANTADLATVATSGSYNDLSDKPVIPDITNLATKSEVDAAKAYYISFATIATTGITDEDWDGIVAAIDAHRPIYAGYPKNDGGILYYGVECMNKNGNNTQIILTSSDDSSHYFYTFTKNGSNDYSFTSETKPYVTDAEKTAWSAKQDALISGTNIKTINNESILGEGNIEIQGGGGGMDEDTELLISSALVDLNDRKIDASEVKENYQKKGDYATNAKVDTKANISDVPTNTDYEEAQKITSWSLNDLNAKFGGVRLQIITQSDYEALATKDNNTLYVIRTD